MPLKEIKQALAAKKLAVDYTDKAPWPGVTPEERLRIYRKCGSKCFMRPSEDANLIFANPKKHLMFPICRPPAPRARKCSISAAGLIAANRRARLSKFPDVIEETKVLIDQLGTTKKARKEVVGISRVKVVPEGDKFVVTVTYANKVKELTKPLSRKVVLKRFQEHLKPAALKVLA